MYSSLITVMHALASIWKGLRDPEFRESFIALIFLLVSGSAFYMAVEGWEPVDAAYFCVMTLSTVGYGDLHPTTQFSRIFTMIYLIAGAGVFVGFITRIAAQRVHYHRPGQERGDGSGGRQEDDGPGRRQGGGGRSRMRGGKKHDPKGS